MNHLKINFCEAIFSALIILGTASSFAADTATPNPKITYIQNGQAVNGWGFQLGDPENWSTPVNSSRKAKSASGKLLVEPVDAKGTGDGLKLTWKSNKNVRGVLALYGSALDLSNLENDAAIAFDMRVDIKPDKDVTFGMDCGYPCRSEVHVSKMLKDLKKGEWTIFPIPLNCFSAKGLDLKKVNGPIVISTDGKLGLTIINAHLIKLPEGEKGCAVAPKTTTAK